METNNMKVTHPFQSVKFDRIAYIGAGMGEHLEELTAALNSSEWLLIEGDEKKIPTLQKKASEFEAENRKIYIKSTILSADGELKTWYNYNLDEYSGLVKATGLNELFPGLKLQSSEAISTQAISEALAEFSSDDEVNGLIIDIPGQSEELLNALSKTARLKSWRFLAITTTDIPLFDSSEDAVAIKKDLANLGYHTRGELGDDPDFPVLYYVMSQAQQQLIAERDDAVVLASSRSKELEQLKQQINEKNNQAEHGQTKINELEQSLTQAKEDTQKQTQWAHSIQNQLNEAETEKKQLYEQLNELRKVFEQAQEERDQANEENQKHTNWAKGLKKELESSNKVIEQKSQQLQEQVYRNQMLEREVAKLEAQVELVTNVVFRTKES